jgi:hypothetical protein
VLAIGFNITCWDVPASSIEEEPQNPFFNPSLIVGGNWPHERVPLFNNYIKIGPWVGDVVTLYTPNVVLDVDGRTGSRVILINHNVSFQVLQCSKSLVTQRGQVRTDSRAIMPKSILPDIQKNHSRWTDHTNSSGEIENEATLMGGTHVSHLKTVNFSDSQLVVDTNHG